ncbi:MAG: thioether cross-link-forming SCIFF peptide maturase, partial [Oscillospiraceae bacterium]|nr:thioether cross-link-forming SCIFF peptide maturase [Oscillospiraceae bacterium]
MIHKYKMSGYNIVLDVESGSVHILDNLTFEMLDHISLPMNKNCSNNLLKKFPNYSESEIKESYAELYSLYKNGNLFSEKGNYEEYKNMMENSPIKAMCLHVSHDCNLRCKYCFASTGDFGGDRKLMSLETSKKSIDFLLENSGERRNLEVDFFGGEPLMNFNVVKQTVSYAREKEKLFNKNFRFTMTTNGVLLSDDKIDYLNKEMDNIVLSLDGRREVNDNMRPKIGGAGSYDSILPKFIKLVNSRGSKDYYVRGTFTKYNIDFAKDVLHMNECGFDQLSVEPVVCDCNEDYAITKDDLPKIFEQYQLLAEQIIEKKKNGSNINIFHFMIDLNQGPCVIKRIKGCGCGNEYIAVTPDGDIYPCHQFVGMDDWKMGNVEDKIINRDIKSKFLKTTILDKQKCMDCWAKFYCSGGCNANNLQYAGDLLTPHELSCEMEKKRIECAI